MLFDSNGVKVDLESNHPIAKDYQSKLSEIREYKFPLRFKTKFSRRINPTGEPEPEQGIRVLHSGQLELKNGTAEKVTYSKTMPRMRAGRLDFATGEFVTNALLVTEKELDKAYFMLYICPVIKKGYLKLENKKEEAKKELEAGSKMAFVYYYLADPDNPFYHDEKKIRQVALSLGVVNAESPSISVEEVKQTLVTHIKKGEAANSQYVNVAAFKEAVQLPEHYQRRASIYRAVENKTLYYDGSAFRWMVKMGDGYVKLMDVTSKDTNSPEDGLLRLMDSNDKVRELFDKATKGEPVPVSKEQVMDMKRPELNDVCKENGIPYVGKKNEDLVKDIIEHLGL